MTKPLVEPAPVAEPSALRPREFEQFRALAHDAFGLDLKAGKEELVSARLRRLVRSRGLKSYGELYDDIVRDKTGEGLAAMIDALATNHTSFLREPDHFQFLRERVVPMLRGRSAPEIWCAACSTGEEVWTLICALNETAPSARVSIRASDISRKALHAAAQALYPAPRCAGIPRAWLDRYFEKAEGPAEAYRVKRELRSQASFQRLNLLAGFSWPKPFPAIFCRNVMIYFDAATQQRVASKLADCLEPGGYLFVGHAESLARFSHQLEYVQPAIYRKPERGSSWNRS